MAKVGIYLYTNKINGKQYVGQSVDIEARHKRHVYRSKGNKPIQVIDRAIKKYGIDNFDFNILVECPKDDLNNQEDYWVKYWDTYKTDNYNMVVGGGSLGAGKDNPSYDHTVYTFRHWDGRSEQLTQFELYTKYKLNGGQLSRVCSGKLNEIKGWGIGDWFKKYHFKRDDGNTEFCSAKRLRQKYNLKRTGISKLCNKVSKFSQGWIIEKGGNNE